MGTGTQNRIIVKQLNGIAGAKKSWARLSWSYVVIANYDWPRFPTFHILLCYYFRM